MRPRDTGASFMDDVKPGFEEAMGRWRKVSGGRQMAKREHWCRLNQASATKSHDEGRGALSSETLQLLLY